MRSACHKTGGKLCVVCPNVFKTRIYEWEEAENRESFREKSMDGEMRSARHKTRGKLCVVFPHVCNTRIYEREGTENRESFCEKNSCNTCVNPSAFVSSTCLHLKLNTCQKYECLRMLKEWELPCTDCHFYKSCRYWYHAFISKVPYSI